MNKLLKVVLLMLLAAFLVTGCNQADEEEAVEEENVGEEQTEDDEQVDESTANDETISLAEDFIEQLSEGQYEEAVEKFDETMAEQLGAAELQELWASLEEQLGDFIDYEYSESGVQDEYEIVLLNGVFNNTDATFQVTVNENQEIAGFFIQ